MKFVIDTVTPCPGETRVGNVYHVKGGSGSRYGHMMVLMAINPAGSCLMMVIDKHGEPTGVTSYGRNYLDDRMPIAFCDGLDDLEFSVRSL